MVREEGRRKIKPFILENDPQKKISRSLSWQSSEPKPSTKLVLQLFGKAKTIALSQIEQNQ